MFPRIGSVDQRGIVFIHRKNLQIKYQYNQVLEYTTFNLVLVFKWFETENPGFRVQKKEQHDFTKKAGRFQVKFLVFLISLAAMSICSIPSVTFGAACFILCNESNIRSDT